MKGFCLLEKKVGRMWRLKGIIADNYLSYGALVSSICHHSRNFHAFSCSFVRRSCNKLVHALAHFSSTSFDVLEDFILHANLAYIHLFADEP